MSFLEWPRNGWMVRVEILHSLWGGVGRGTLGYIFTFPDPRKLLIYPDVRLTVQTEQMIFTFTTPVVFFGRSEQSLNTTGLVF